MNNPFRRKAITGSEQVIEALQNRTANVQIGLGGTNQQIHAAWLRGQQASYGWMYVNTPAVRTVVDYVARNVAQLGLKLYERVDDTQRERATDHPAALTMAAPGGGVPADQFIFRFVADYLVFHNAYALKFRNQGMDRISLVRLPPDRVAVSGGAFTAEMYRVWRTDGSHFDVRPEDIIHWRGYNPHDPLMGVSPLETLRSTITEDQVSQATTVELMKNGLKGGHIERPIEAPDWSEEARKRFQEGWRNQRATSPRLDPVLEEGMKWVPTAISPKDAELLAGRKWTVEEVARVYGVPLEPFGLGGQGADLVEARKQVYTDVLPPITDTLAGQLDQDILVAEYAASDYYFEFDLNEKLRGDPIARFQAITSATGAPWITRNEARALENRPPIDGGDEIITPLNVLVGDNPKPSPVSMPIQDPNKPAQDGSHRENPKQVEWKAAQLLAHRRQDMARQRAYVNEARGVMENYYGRLGRAAKSAERQKAPFDMQQWDTKLASRLHELVVSIVEREGTLYVQRLAGQGFDMNQVGHYLKAMAENIAKNVNDATAADIADVGVTDAIARGRRERAATTGVSIGARAAIFAREEAAKQSPGYGLRRKTWIADTARHAEMDGVTVPVGADWPIGFAPGSAPACACTMSIS